MAIERRCKLGRRLVDDRTRVAINCNKDEGDHQKSTIQRYEPITLAPTMVGKTKGDSVVAMEVETL
jgi:hypothetical protein